MAQYKVIQDVEAEDKILGPLSLKQLIFASITVGIIFIAFRLVMATGVVYIAIPFLPFVLVFGILAAPLGRDQPTEMWLAAQIRFFTKPRVRLWDQSGIKELVHITVPKGEERIYTDGLNQTQVRSRLKALASTLDSRGWAVKNVDVNLYATSSYGQYASDRLVDPSSMPIAVSDIDIKPADDIMDVTNNETAHHFEELMQASSAAHHQAVLATMRKNTTPQSAPPAPADYWFMNQPAAPSSTTTDVMFEQAVVQPQNASTAAESTSFLQPKTEESITPEEQQIIERAKREKQKDQVNYSSHHKVVLTLEQQQALAKKQQQEQAEQERIAREKQAEIDRQKAREEQTRLSKTDTIELANANDINIASIASLAEHKAHPKQSGNNTNEVVIKLR